MYTEGVGGISSTGETSRSKQSAIYVDGVAHILTKCLPPFRTTRENGMETCYMLRTCKYAVHTYVILGSILYLMMSAKEKNM